MSGHTIRPILGIMVGPAALLIDRVRARDGQEDGGNGVLVRLLFLRNLCATYIRIVNGFKMETLTKVSF